VDALPPVHTRRLQDPHVLTCKVATRHLVLTVRGGGRRIQYQGFNRGGGLLRGFFLLFRMKYA
jgi:hypothetical protein